VRLKAFDQLINESNFSISIPFGAIKSSVKWSDNGNKKAFQFLLVRLKAFPDNSPDLSYLFQFLLVRLKGTITGKEPKGTKEFQFLLVRLKVEEVEERGMNARVFQFLLVRLKALKVVEYENGVQHFNSFWCD